MFFKKVNMKWKTQGILLALVCGLTVAAPAGAQVDLKKLRVITSDVKPGLWLYTFTIIPKVPFPPDRHEEACVSAAQLQQIFKSDPEQTKMEQRCTMTVESDSITKAAFIWHCPAMNIPRVGTVPAVEIPAYEIPGEIVRTGGEEHWVMTIKMPAVSNRRPATEWRTEFTRLGACKN